MPKEPVNVKFGNKQIKYDSIRIPKFKIESRLDLTDQLKRFGLKAMFEGGLAGIAKDPVQVSQVIQDAVIEIDEKGAKAAAVTLIKFVPTSARFGPPPRTFTLDRPFLYQICLVKTGTVLFSGRIINPAKS